MSQNDNTLQRIISVVQEKLNDFLQLDDLWHLVIIDPVDKKLISSDYAQSHCAVSFLLSDESYVIEKGVSMVKALLTTWLDDIKIPSFHFDFNNLALCIAENRLAKLSIETELQEQIRSIVINTQDSIHDTVNWLPMRYYVNYKRYEWTKNREYKSRMTKIRAMIDQAIWDDGFIDDRSKKGISFNLQYNLATVAMMEFINEELQSEEFNIYKCVNALIQTLLPDGDINYLGRGCNQVFAWGLWLYLLKATGQNQYYKDSLEYLSKRIDTAIDNNNLMLNECNGNDKYLWWDYHYSSVYMAHLCMWLRLTQMLQDKPDCSYKQKAEYGSDSGVRIQRFASSTVSIFLGRESYLAERGPVVSALCTQKHGVIFKGGFAPWQGAFGNKYTHILPAMYGFCGLLNIKTNSRIMDNRFFRRLNLYIPVAAKAEVTPLFVPIQAEENDGCVEIYFQNTKRKLCQFNVPIFSECNIDRAEIEVFADEDRVHVFETGAIHTQYGMSKLWQTQPYKARVWRLRILAEREWSV